MITPYPIFSYSKFLSGLMRAAHGVGLLTETGEENAQRMTTSAWLITDDLIVVPGHMIVRPQSTYSFSFEDHAIPDRITSVKAFSVDVAPDPPVRLLRLEHPISGSGLPLELNDASEIHDVYILHFPGGRFPLKLSIGRISGTKSNRIFYDASTEPGSGGGPVFTTGGKVVGTHIGTTPKRTRNEGVSLHAMFEMLQKTSQWDEIAAYHKIAIAKKEIESASPINQDLLVKVAVQWNFKKDNYSEEDQKLLSSLVVNPQTPVWSLKPSERQRIIGGVKSKKQLADVLSQLSNVGTSVGQEVINNILSGSKYRISEIPEHQLPYWLQAVRWFSKVIPALPSTEEINRELQKRRTRADLETIGGVHFIGREPQLKQLRQWVLTKLTGPMVVSGIGGIGKSSLISKFILTLPQKALVLWLDFDRADLAPDDAGSILRLIQSQLSVHIKNYKPVTLDTNWKKGAVAIGAKIATAGKKLKNIAPVLVMDGFEVAQHVQRYHEIWPVLEKIMTKVPSMHVIVSGRAPVKNLKLRKRTSQAIELKGMDLEQMRVWLSNEGITDESDIKRIAELTDGVPLKLKLIVRYLADENPLSDLAKINSMMLEGYLYQRILDRVIDPTLKEIAQDVLIVRQLTAEMISAVFADKIPKGLTANETFERILAEQGLVTEAIDSSSSADGRDDPKSVSIRPEVRTATLKLLEHDKPDRVHEIDTRAIEHYQAVPAPGFKEISELIYHNLRLGNLEKAKQLWHPECTKFLADAVNDLPDSFGKEKEWLKDTLDSGSPDNNLESWESDALSRIKIAAKRNRVPIRLIKGILSENVQRSKNSPLLVFDAWTLWKEDRLPEARSALELPPAKPAIEFDRAIVRACLAELDDKPEVADEILERIDDDQIKGRAWDERLLVRGARLQLNTNLLWELDVLAKLKKDPGKAARLANQLQLTASDAVVTELAENIFPNLNSMRLVTSLTVPEKADHLMGFRSMLENERARSVPSGRTIPLRMPGLTRYDPVNLKNDVKNLDDRATARKINNLATLGWRRAMLITDDLFVFDALTYIANTKNTTDRNFMAILSSLVAIRGIRLDHTTFGDASGDLIDLTIDRYIRATRMRTTGEFEKRFQLALKFIGEVPGSAANNSREMLKKLSVSRHTAQYIFFDDLTDKLEKREWRVILYFILAPSCLEVLTKKALGINDDEPFSA